TYVAGLNGPRRIEIIADRLLKSGYSGTVTEKVVGGNFALVFTQIWVWEAPPPRPAPRGTANAAATVSLVRYVTRRRGHARLPRRFSERLQALACELRYLAGFLVLEVDVDLSARGGVGTDHARPVAQLIRGITLIAQAEVAVAPGDLDRSRELLAVGGTQGQLARSQARPP